MEHSRKLRNLAWITLGYNLVECLVSVAAGWTAGSVALLGFGGEALIEASSAMVVLWRFQGGHNHAHREERSRKLVALSLWALAASVAWGAISSLMEQRIPSPSWLGMGITLASGCIMPFLARAKRRAGNEIGSRAAVADSRQTDLCALLSWIILGGLVLNATLGWWWADPVAALFMVWILHKEAGEAWRGESCGSGCGCH